jgi:putative hemolysin
MDKNDNLAGILEKLQKTNRRLASDRALEPIAAAVEPVRLVQEMQASEMMVDSHPHLPHKGLAIYRNTGSNIPATLDELGRLREETFRTVGEGSGLSRDLDQFDSYYDHFWAWDKAKNEITGAYRIGRVDLILKERGPTGIYSNTLFNLNDLLLTDFKAGTLEAGRSFVRPEFQRGLSLLYIWMALARFICANPVYNYLMGPVSISNEFQDSSKHLMVNYLMKNHVHEKSNMVTSKNPPQFDTELSPEELTSVIDSALNLSSLQDFVRMAEGNPKAQIPQLIKLYIELGVRFLAFNKDDEFNTIDGLIWLNIPKMPTGIGHRYFGEEPWAKYVAHHP